MSERPGLLASPLVIPAIAGLMVIVRRTFGFGDLVVPSPIDVVSALWNDLTSATMYAHVWVTTYEVLLGLVLGSVAGFILGSILAQYRFLEDIFYPYIVGFQSMPKVALAPLLVLWLGFGASSKVLIAALMSFFPLLINVMIGLRSVDRSRLEMMQVMNANAMQVWRFVRLPTALPMIIAGVQVGAVLSMVGAIVGEFVGTSAGIGYLILQRNTQIDTASVYSALIFLAVMGWALTYLVRWAGRKALFWAPDMAGDRTAA